MVTVHEDGLERHQQGPEDDQQQHERHGQHGAEEDEHPLGEVVGDVDGDGGSSGDVDVEAGAGRRGGDDVGAETTDECGGGSVLRSGRGDEAHEVGSRLGRVVGDRRGDGGDPVGADQGGVDAATESADPPTTVIRNGPLNPSPNPSASRS